MVDFKCTCPDKLLGACEDHCKCKTGGLTDGGKLVNSAGYCEYHCSVGG